jgi:ubiquinone/menaquinone biosynthesis C-methylase UbiE
MLNNPFLDIINPRPLGAGSYDMALPLVNALKLKPGMRILEIGAGTGQVASTLVNHWKVSVVTLEIWENLNVIQSQAAKQGVENLVLAMKVNAENLPFPDESFDVVFGIGSFLMIENREKALKEIIRITRKSGYIGIAEPMCTTNPIPDELDKFNIFKSYKKWLRTLNWNRNIFMEHGISVTESYYFPESYLWMVDNFQYYDGKKDFILEDQGRWLSLGLIVGMKP